MLRCSISMKLKETKVEEGTGTFEGEASSPVLDLLFISAAWITMLIVVAFLLFVLTFILEKRDCESYQEDDMTEYRLWVLD